VKSRMLFSTLVALSLAALLSGCGQNSTPTGVTALDETAPAAPSSLTKVDDAATTSGWLAWEPSVTATVAGYEVYQYSPDPSRDDAYLLVGETDASTTRYALPASSEPQTVYYRLKAVSTAGIRSPWSTTAGIVVYSNNGAGEPEPSVDEPLPMKRPAVNP
jgi:hypothetical protein